MPDRRRHGAHEDRGAGGAAAPSRGPRCTTGWSGICRATRRGRRGFRRSRTCATRGRHWRGCPRSTPASARGASFRRGARTGSGTRAGGQRRDAPRSCCSPIRSTAISSPRMSVRRRRCSSRRLPGPSAKAGGPLAGRSGAADVPVGRPGRPGPCGSASARWPRSTPYVTSGISRDRAPAELHPGFPRRDPALAEDRGSAMGGVARHAVRGVRDARA